MNIKETAAALAALVGEGRLAACTRQRPDGSAEPCFRVCFQGDGADGADGEGGADGADGQSARDETASLPGLKILSPFDPLVRNRDRLENMFGFSYRFEAYVPKAKRKFGYYIFPVLEDTDFIGRIDMSLEKDTGNKGQTLAVRKFWPEPGVRDTVKRRAALKRQLKAYQKMAGAGALDICTDFWQ